MKKIALSLATVVVAVTVACPSPLDSLCLEQATCAGEDDPETFCAKANARLDKDERRVRDACRAEDEALATCILQNGTCDDDEGDSGMSFDVTDPDDCVDESAEAADCIADND
jgi:hypothetical protein